jgi:hypothetical protein
MLRRAADGTLRPAAEEANIADIWAEQKRIRLQQAIEDDKRRKLKQQQRRERKLLGRAVTIQKSATEGGQAKEKEIEIRLSLPKFHMPNWDDVEDFLARVELPKFKKKHTVLASCSAGVIVLALVALAVFGGRHNSHPGGKTAHGNTAKASVLSASQQPHNNSPQYNTLLPKGKTIGQLGGWGRVSPPENNPVYAYADKIEGMAVTVSEQPLPDDYIASPQSHISGLAKQFNATKQLMTPTDAYAYIGTSVQSAQSVVAGKQGLLILIHSTQPIHESSWVAYLDSLQ